MPTPFRVEEGNTAATPGLYASSLKPWVVSSSLPGLARRPKLLIRTAPGWTAESVSSFSPPLQQNFLFGFQNDGKCTPNSSVRQHCEIDLDVECPELSRFVMNIAISRNIKGAPFAVGCDFSDYPFLHPRLLG